MKNSDNYILPGEWEKHAAVWLAWPHDTITFGSLNEKDDKLNKTRLPIVEQKYVEIISAISSSEEVELLVVGESMKAKVTELLQKAGVNLTKINFHITDYADVWLRDYGPLFVSNPQTKEQAWVKWIYNAYGEKFEDLLKDNEVFFKLRGKIDKRMLEPEIVLESGAIESNGSGVLLTTEQCLLSPTRNPSKTEKDYENIFKNFLGTQKVIWLNKGLVNDHTDGHIDEIARFVSPSKIVCAYEENQSDENFKALQENYEALSKATDQNEKPFAIVKLPLPHLTYSDGNRIPASYCNFYIGNKVVLAAVFADPNDQKALEILQGCFPDRKVVPIDCSQIIYGGGAIHCMTMQQPLN